MRVALDAQLAVGTATGIGEYAGGLLRALPNAGIDTVALADERIDPWRFDRRVLWDQVVLPLQARRSGAQLLHCAAGTMPLLLPLPCVVTVHDLAWLKVQRHARAYARWYFGAFSAARYRGARRIVVDSEFSRTELLGAIAYDAGCVEVVYPGVADDFCELQRFPDGAATILVPGTVEPRKNLEAIVRVLATLARARLISVGPPTPYRDACAALARRLGVEDRVEFRGYVERSELTRLYATCAVVAVPSHYEGFGYAAAQALCAGTPLVVSDAGSLREIVSDAAAVVAADDDGAWRAAIVSILEGAGAAEARAQRARSAACERFAWHSAALRMRGVYERALAES